MVRAVLAALIAVVCLGSPAAAGPSGELVVSGVRATQGEVRFFLAARTPVTTVTVSLDGAAVPARVVPLPVAERPARAVVIAVDTSGSMAGARIAAARAAALEYASALPADVRLGLVSFAERAVVRLAPTLDRPAFASAVGALAAGGGTALHDAIRSSASLLDESYVDRQVVVLSDGEDTSSASPLVRGLDGVILTVVAYGPAAATLDDLANGGVLAAADADQLRSAFRSLATGLAAPVEVVVTVPASSTGPAVLTVSVGESTVDVPVTLRGSLTAVSAQRFRVPDASTRPLYVALAALALAFLIAGLALAYRAAGRSAKERRLRQLDAFGPPSASQTTPQPSQSSPAGVLTAALAVSQKAVDRQGSESTTEAQLERAGMSLRPAEWLLLRAGVSLGLGVLLVLVMPWWLGLVVGLALGWFATAMYPRHRIARRAVRFAELLPESLQLVVGALRSGFSLAQAVDALVREGPEPVAGEFGRALSETRLGGELEDALDRAAARNASADLGWLVMAIRIQREVGGNLSEVLQTAVDTMRERERLNRHVRALSAEGRLSAYVLVAMPVLIGGWLFAFRTEYLRPLYTQPLGLVMLGTAVLFLAAGAFWISRLIRVDV